MLNKKNLFLFVLPFIFTACSSNETVADNTPAAPDYAAVDNTQVNQRDRNDRTLTPTDQVSGTKSDVEVTRQIRRLITKDDTLSTNAHNVKIITLKGVTTLRGPVNSVEERSRIVDYANRLVGANAVRNQLEVKN